MVRCWSIFVVFLILSVAGASVARAQDDFDDSDGPSFPWTLGLYGVYGGLDQGAKSFQTADQLNYTTSGYSGSSFQPGVFLDDPYSSTMSLRFFASYQMTSLQGNATEVNVPIAPKKVQLNETMLGVGAEIQFIPTPGEGFWYGLGAEYSMTLALNLSLDGSNVPTSAADFPNYFYTFVSAGWNQQFSKGWVFAPELRVGDVFFAKPGIFIYEVFLGIGHTVSF